VRYAAAPGLQARGSLEHIGGELAFWNASTGFLGAGLNRFRASLLRAAFRQGRIYGGLPANPRGTIDQSSAAGMAGNQADGTIRAQGYGDARSQRCFSSRMARSSGPCGASTPISGLRRRTDNTVHWQLRDAWRPATALSIQLGWGWRSWRHRRLQTEPAAGV